jgi:hypothetical protein
VHKGVSLAADFRPCVSDVTRGEGWFSPLTVRLRLIFHRRLFVFDQQCDQVATKHSYHTRLKGSRPQWQQ